MDPLGFSSFARDAKYNFAFANKLFAAVRNHSAKLDLGEPQPLTPSLVAQMHRSITAKNIPCTHVIAGAFALKSISSSEEFCNYVDPTQNKHSLLVGFHGFIFGMDIFSASPFDCDILPNFFAVVALNPDYSDSCKSENPVVELKAIEAVLIG